MPPDDDMASRTKQLAQDLLDEMDKPKSPEREAYEAQKEREDREALERFYIATGQATPDLVMKRTLAELADKIERLDPPGPFEPIELAFTFKDRKGVVRFAPHPNKPDKRSIELSIQSESGVSTSSRFLDHGSNASLVSYLRKPEVVADTIATAEELMEALSRNRLA